ncbi:MAG: ATP-binding cassette domain-containing protein [bacterium]|nr:ATP-binding cassette domain-containing protein [bacterium]
MKPAIEVEEISFSFGGFRVIDGISLSGNDGETLGIIGPNGSGKSTFFDLLSGFRTAESGRIRLNGRDVTRMAPEVRASHGLGRTFQRTAAFYGLTVAEHLRIPRLARRMPASDRVAAAYQIVEELLGRTGIGERQHEPVESLAAGECRILDLARAITQAPCVILLDEPFAGIDGAQEKAVTTCIRQASTMACVILVEHRLEALLSLVGRVLVFHQGRVLATGDPSEVLNRGEVLRAYRGELRESPSS